MKRTRVVFLAVSLASVLLFSGLLMASRSSEEELFQALGNLAEVVHLVLTDYVDELNQEALSLSLDAGIVESIDPTAAVLSSDDVDGYVELLRTPPPYGLGLGLRLGSAAVRHALPGSPAAAAGLETWEVIERIEGVNTRGRPLWEIRLELRAREARGQPVTLTVVDRRVDERREVTLEATPWQVQAVSVEDYDGARRLLIHGLPEGSVAAVREQVTPGDRWIIDLRELVWGFEEEAIATADLFVAEGVLGEWRGRRAGERRFDADPQVITEGAPMVLVGPNTEGVGEILAAALQRAGATLVGSNTAGHAPHMRLIHDGDIHLWLPVAYWLRGDGGPIDGNGLEPDEVVETAVAEEEDPVLERALELATQELDVAA